MALVGAPHAARTAGQQAAGNAARQQRPCRAHWPCHAARPRQLRLASPCITGSGGAGGSAVDAEGCGEAARQRFEGPKRAARAWSGVNGLVPPGRDGPLLIDSCCNGWLTAVSSDKWVSRG
jgi:hypothetical protein